MPIQERRRLIKAHSLRPPGSSAAFNIEDLQRDCDEYVTQARSRGEEILAQAVAEADDVRQRAFEQGHRAGEQAGYAAAQDLVESRARELAAEQARDQLATVLPALNHVIEALEREREQWLTAWESAAIRLSAIMAEKIVRRELSHDPRLATEVIREALQLAAGSPQITLRLHPLDLAQLNDSGPDVLERLAHAGETSLTPDESVARGGCLIETRQGTIDARIETQLARIVNELLES